MIELYSFGGNFNLADPSPFVLKVDAYLRMSGLEFRQNVSPQNLRKAPKGKLPFITDKGKTIADSQFIIDYLRQEYGDQLDSHLSNEQKAIAYLITKSLDENLYFCMVYSRWLSDTTWPLINKTFFGKLPIPLRWIIPGIVRKNVKRSLLGQGIARHSESEVLAICKKSLQALADLLADKQYFFGDKPSSLDATAFAFLAELILVDFDNQFNSMAREFPTLVSYCERIKQKYY